VACSYLSGCAQEGPYAPPDTTLRVPDSQQLSGVVSADGSSDIAVDIGATRPVSVTLAEVTVAGCGSDGLAALSGAFTKLLPVGTPVVLVRSGMKPQRHDMLSAFVYVRRPDQPGAATPTGASVNELVVAAGLGRVSPAVDRSATAAPVDGQVAIAAAALPAPDRTYLSALVTAETKAWDGGAGVLPGCVARQHDQDRAHTPAGAPVAAPATPSTPAAPPAADTPIVRRPDIRIDIQIQREARPRPLCRLTSRC
jgi:hypothetical protein